MSASGQYDTYDIPYRQRSHRYREREDREPRYVETSETYIRQPAGKNAPLSPDAAYARQTQVIRRPHREDSDLSVEEIRREFPPPGGARRARSAERYAQYQYYDDPRRSTGAVDRGRDTAVVYEERVTEPRRRSLSRNQKIIAAVSGAALAVGGKELWDRRKNGGSPPAERNLLGTAAIGAAGAFAAYEGAEAYAKHGGEATRKVKSYIASNGRGGAAEYYSSDEESLRSGKSAKKGRRKSIVESALGLAGIGAAAKAASGHHERDRSRDRRSRRRDGSYDSYDSRESRYSKKRSHSPEGAAKLQQAAKAALLAGAAEAFRLRKQPGDWRGEKGKRILTAAIGAGGIDAATDHDPEHKSKRHILEAVIGGLTGNRLINGSRREVDDDGYRSRSRSRSRRSRSRSRGPGGSSGLPALAAAGLTALAGKKLLDRSRSRSRSRSVSRSRSRGGRRRRHYSSDDSRSPSPRRRRSRSVTDFARKGLAAVGIGEAASSMRDRDRGTREVEETRVIHRRRKGSDEGYAGRSDSAFEQVSSRNPYADPRYSESRGSVGSRDSDRGSRNTRDTRGASTRADGRKNRAIAEGRRSASSSSSDSDLGSSTDDEKKVKKMRGKQFVTAGLATVATIHAAHNVYSSMEKRQARRKAVKEGEMSLEEARKLKAKATLQDVASIGIAALGIKGAMSEWKEMQEMRKECRELEHQKKERHKKRMQRMIEQGRESRRREDGYRPANDSYGSQGPVYADANPYASTLPAPPVGGYDDRR